MKFIRGIITWFLVTVLGICAGLLVIILLSLYLELNPLFLRLVILFTIAFFNAIFSRMLQKNIWAFIQIILVLLSSILGIFVIDKLYDSEYQFEFSQGIKNLQDIQNIQIPSIRDGSQMLFLLVISLPFLLFFRKKRKKVSKHSRKQNLKTNISEGWKSFTYKANPANWSTHGKNKIKSVKRSHMSSSLHVNGQPAHPVHLSSNRKQATRIKTGSKKKPFIKSSGKKIRLPGNIFHTGANHDVKLTGEEEHVCPYCLEEVRKADPRGVVICKECSTWHHEDCWNLAGACGIAHRNEL